MAKSDSLHPHQTGVKIRNTREEDIPKIVNLQRESFPYLARYGNVWHPDELQSHLHKFSEGQFVAVEPDGPLKVRDLEVHVADPGPRGDGSLVHARHPL